MVKESIQDGGGEGVVVVEYRRPLLEGFVGGLEDGTAFVASAKAVFDIKNPLGIWRNCIETLYKINLPLQLKETKSGQVSEE